MNTIEFPHNRNNKLDNDAFCFFALADDIRTHFPGNKYNICLREGTNVLSKGIAQVEFALRIKLQELNDFYCFMAMGQDKQTTIDILEKMYRDKNINIHKKDWHLVMLRKLTETKIIPKTIPTTDQSKPTLQKENKYLEKCPNCDKDWNHKEIQFQTCDLCGFPNHTE